MSTVGRGTGSARQLFAAIESWLAPLADQIAATCGRNNLTEKRKCCWIDYNPFGNWTRTQSHLTAIMITMAMKSAPFFQASSLFKAAKSALIEERISANAFFRAASSRCFSILSLRVACI